MMVMAQYRSMKGKTGDRGKKGYGKGKFGKSLGKVRQKQ